MEILSLLCYLFFFFWFSSRSRDEGRLATDVNWRIKLRILQIITNLFPALSYNELAEERSSIHSFEVHTTSMVLVQLIYAFGTNVALNFL